MCYDCTFKLHIADWRRASHNHLCTGHLKNVICNRFSAILWKHEQSFFSQCFEYSCGICFQNNSFLHSIYSRKLKSNRFPVCNYNFISLLDAAELQLNNSYITFILARSLFHVIRKSIRWLATSYARGQQLY